ncbi:Uma2 family endonuclease [Jiella sp. M17.18]|uniref:Uma2 family endonuclease n=1 Tax=Jiella sp. M17.18 TaxID=3234247 RepID=UPI0034DF36AF
MGTPKLGPMTADSFLDWIETESGRYELVDGYPIEMVAGRTQSHNVAASNILLALVPPAKARGWRATIKRTAVRTGDRGVRFPDLAVDCGPPNPSAKEASRPTLVVEVSSPSGLSTDVTDKLDEYRQHPDIRVIMFVEPDVVSIKLYRRAEFGEWTIEKYGRLEETTDLPEIGARLPWAAIYDTLEPKLRPALQVVPE